MTRIDKELLDELIEALENGCPNCESEDDGTFESCEKHKAMWEFSDALLARLGEPVECLYDHDECISRFCPRCGARLQEDAE